MSAKSLFTDNLPSDLQDVVRRIADGGATKFRSNPTTYDENGKGWVNYDLAWKVPDTGLWTVETHKCFLHDGAISQGQKKTVARNVSFFDALYQCAHSENARVTGGQKKFEDDSDITHFTKVAKAAKQPLDITGLPHPAAYGQILTDGNFDTDQTKLAEATAHTKLAELLPQQSAAMSHGIIEKLGDMPAAVSKVPIDDIDNIIYIDRLKDSMEDIISFAEQAKEKTDDAYSALKYTEFFPDLKAEFQKQAGNGFLLSMFFIALGGVAGLTASFPIVFIPGMPESVALVGIMAGLVSVPFWDEGFGAISERGHRKRLQKLHDIADGLPESALQTKIREFATCVDANRQFIRASKTLEDNAYKHKWKLKKVFGYVAKGAEILELSEMQATQLQDLITKRQFPDKEYFQKDMEKRLDALKLSFGQAQNALLTSDIKAITHSPEEAIEMVLMSSPVKEKVPK